MSYREGNEPVTGYTLVEFLGRGSYGEVWKATGPGGTEVALKFIALDSQQGMKEFKAIGLVKKLRHTNLVPIHAFWLRDSLGNLISDAPGAHETESSRFRIGGQKELVIAMGLGDKSLAQRAEETRGDGGIPQRELLRYMDGAARGIDFLNEPIHPPGNTPIIHCDIKPGNLLIVGGEVQVCDYGVAQALGADMKKSLGAGTPAYAPPELINNDPCPQTDQYSLAIAYYELRTGRLPFDEKHALRANMTGELDFSLVERDERAVLRKATNLQPERRFATVEAMVEELRVACGVSQSRSGVIPRALERKGASAGHLPPVPKRPSAELGPTHDTVTFPDSLRPTAPAPKPSAQSETPWADSSQLMPALPATPKPAAPLAGKKWLWPLVIGLLIGVGGITAYVVTRPKGDEKAGGTTPVPPPDKQEKEKPKETEKPKEKEKEKPADPPAPTAADLFKKLADAKFATAADVTASVKRIEEALKTPKLSTVEAKTFRDGLPAFVRLKLKAAEEPFAWVAALTVTDLPPTKGKDLAAAKAWFAEASRAARLFDDPDHQRLATLGRFAGFAADVSAEGSELKRFEKAREWTGDFALPPALRYQFVYKPLDGGALADKTAGAARVLVAAAGDLVAGSFWEADQPPTATNRKESASKLLVRAGDSDWRAAVAAVTAAKNRDKLPCDDLAGATAKKGIAAEARALKAVKADAELSKTERAAAIELLKAAIGLPNSHPDLADWHSRLASNIYLVEVTDKPSEVLKPGSLTPEQVRFAATTFEHYQTAYLIVAERTAAGKRPSSDDAALLDESRAIHRDVLSTNLSAMFASQAKGGDNAAFWQALDAECAYMRSDMKADARKTLEKAKYAGPAKADADLTGCRARIARLLAVKQTRGELIDQLKAASKGK